MPTFVLIHGAWHGGWCWWKVEPLLRQSVSRVYAPSLTGMGERSHLARHLDPAAINLDLHIQDVVLDAHTHSKQIKELVRRQCNPDLSSNGEGRPSATIFEEVQVYDERGGQHQQ